MHVRSLLIILIACGGSPAPAAPPTPPPIPADAAVVGAEAIAREVVSKLAAHDFVAARSHFDDKMLAELPLDKLAVVWKQLEDGFGAFERIESATRTDTDTFHGFAVSARFARAQIVFRIAFDDHNRVAGLFVGGS